MNLTLVDASALIHAGHINTHAVLERSIVDGTLWSTRKTPAGGTAQLLNYLIPSIRDGDDIVICFDRNPTIKKEMYSGYKANRARSHRHSMEVEKRVCEYICQQCNFQTYAFEGYEADDCIYTYWKQRGSFYNKIKILSGDSDLHFMINEKTSVYPVKEKGRIVNFENYTQYAGNKGAVYNNVTLSKIIAGDTSDNIPALHPDIVDSLRRHVFRQDLYPYMGDKSVVEYYVSTFVPSALKQVRLVFPLDVEEMSNLLEIKQYDRKKIGNFGAAIRAKEYKGSGDHTFDITPHLIKMQDSGLWVEESEYDNW